MSIEEDIHKGQMAKELLENPILKEIFEEMRETLTKAWLSSPARDDAGRERIYVMAKTVEKFEEHLNSYVNNGKFASKKLELEEKKAPFQKEELK